MARRLDCAESLGIARRGPDARGGDGLFGSYQVGKREERGREEERKRGREEERKRGREEERKRGREEERKRGRGK
jgi:hypothetical protein